MMRMALSGAAWGRSASHTPSAFSMSTELSRSAAVRVSRGCGRAGAGGGGPISATREPPWASASAAARPVGPAADNGNVDVMSIASAKICSRVDYWRGSSRRSRRLITGHSHAERLAAFLSQRPRKCRASDFHPRIQAHSRKVVLATPETKKSRHIANHDPIGRVLHGKGRKGPERITGGLQYAWGTEFALPRA